MLLLMSTMMVGEHQLLGNRIANLIFSFFSMVIFQSRLVEKLLEIGSFDLFFQEELRLGYSLLAQCPYLFINVRRFLLPVNA